MAASVQEVCSLRSSPLSIRLSTGALQPGPGIPWWRTSWRITVLDRSAFACEIPLSGGPKAWAGADLLEHAVVSDLSRAASYWRGATEQAAPCSPCPCDADGGRVASIALCGLEALKARTPPPFGGVEGIVADPTVARFEFGLVRPVASAGLSRHRRLSAMGRHFLTRSGQMPMR